MPSVVDHERLRLAAREQRRAVRARQDADLARDRADVGEAAAVDALALVARSLADDAASSTLVEQLADELLRRSGIVGAERARQRLVACASSSAA